MATTCEWAGQSGQKYGYHVYDLRFAFSPKQDGNYIFTKIVNNTWIPIYIGEGDLQDRTSSHISNGCVAGKGATHIHAHVNKSAPARKAEESDLLAGHPKAYVPAGCNVRLGG